jgi:hypothetical protein
MSILEDLNMLIEAKKLDPKAGVRNKPSPVFDADDKNVTDKKDHFPLGTENQARNALAQANKYDKTPAWYKGTLESLKKKVAAAVKKQYPLVKITKKSID